MNVLLIEPKRSKAYHTTYPPLGLLKIATYHRLRGDTVLLINGPAKISFVPDKIYVTSLFTYAWRPVHEVINHYSKLYPKAEITVGGIYATLCPEHLRTGLKTRFNIVKGIYTVVENLLPDYSLIPNWNKSILFASRGCIRKCNYCSVPILETKFKPRRSIKGLIYPGHKEVVFWDNNFLASPFWRDIFHEITELGVRPDFNQGLDARLVTDEVVSFIKKLKPYLVRLAYDSMNMRKHIKRSITLLKKGGINPRRILVYCLYNFKDNPDELLERVRNIIAWGGVAYPMRYEPLEPRDKATYVSEKWTGEELELLARARRVLGTKGAFPPYERLKNKLFEAADFEQAFSLRPRRRS